MPYFYDVVWLYTWCAEFVSRFVQPSPIASSTILATHSPTRAETLGISLQSMFVSWHCTSYMRWSFGWHRAHLVSQSLINYLYVWNWFLYTTAGFYDPPFTEPIHSSIYSEVGGRVQYSFLWLASKDEVIFETYAFSVSHTGFYYVSRWTAR